MSQRAQPKPKFKVGQVVRDCTDPEYMFGEVIWREFYKGYKGPSQSTQSLVAPSIGLDKPEWFYCVGGEANIVAEHRLRALTQRECGK